MASTSIRPIPSTPQNEQVTGALPSKSDAKSQASKGAAALQPDTVTLSAAAKSQQAQSTATQKRQLPPRATPRPATQITTGTRT